MKRFTLLSLVLIMAAFSFVSAKSDNEKSIIKIRKHGDFTLGVVFTNPDKELLETLKLKGGALVLEVLENSEAEKIGIKKDDVITSFDGTIIDDARELDDLAEKIEQEKTVEIIVNRDQKTKKFEAKLKPSEGGHAADAVTYHDDILIDIDEDLKGLKDFHFYTDGDDLSGYTIKGGFLGVEVKDLSDQLKEYFKVEYGVLIEKIIEDTPAENAGLKAGDVIMKINDKKIEDYSDLVRSLNFYDPEDKVIIEFSRKEKTKKLDVVLAKKRSSNYMHKKLKGKKPVFWKKSKDFKLPGLFKYFPDIGKIEIFII